MWLSTGQAAAVPPVQLPAHDSSINVFNPWQIKKTAGSKCTDFQHWQQSISSEPGEAAGREEQQSAGTRLHPGLQQLMSPAHPHRQGQGHPCSCTSPSKSRIPGQGQAHTAHWLRFSTYSSALLMTLPLGKNDHQQQNTFFLSKCDFCFQNPGRKLETIH